ncbi:uracil DNA N-glycosylase Thp1 [Coemansia erecta]|uniref:Uracil DNA N-glycosylase Thp1 n=1 Tax=Coemansia asiatica TaxID=1052880 RepID=A0A9W8CHN1_9FUNG|nr:uracil DNA N-glycosylase Thp1 [Coemansia asiatica]KAJ2855411.1 uracil DNA N-glycosylase Thp1 [Coemansia erecta]
MPKHKKRVNSADLAFDASLQDAKKSKPVRPSEEEIAKLPPIPESIRPDLDILFVGINPGVMSGQKQLHFGNPMNYFWRGLYESGLIPEQIQPEQGGMLFSEWNMSIVNLVQRTTRSTSDLSIREMRESVPELCRKISFSSPKIICFVGLGIYKVFANKSKVEPGLQQETYDYCKDKESSLAKHGYIFVMPSTSGRTSAYQNPEKLAYLRQLKYLRDCVTAQPAPQNVDHAVLDSLGPQTRSKYFSKQI